MPNRRIPKEQKWHAFRQAHAGVHWKQIQKNQRRWFGDHAPVMHRNTIGRAFANGMMGDAAPRKRSFRPGHSLTKRHRRLIRELMQRCAETSTEEYVLMLRRAELRFARARAKFARSTIDDFIRDTDGNTYKVLTAYDTRKNGVESARCRAALKRLPVQSLVVIDASHVDTRQDSARKKGRAKKGSRAYARRFLGRDGIMRSVLGVMTIRGMFVKACGFFVSHMPPTCVLTDCLLVLVLMCCCATCSEAV